MSRLAQRALARLAGGDHAGALALLTAPQDAEDHAVRGMARLATADWPAARDSLAAATAGGDHSPATRLNLALAEDRLGDDGRSAMQALAGEHPGWDEPPLRLAESLRRAGDAAGACAAYERTLTINPDRVEALIGLAALLLVAGEREPARRLLLRGCALAPARAEAWDALGRATPDPALAAAAYAEAARLRPEVIGYALRRTQAAQAAGQGAAELVRLSAADPLDAAATTARGALLHWLGRANEAADTLALAATLAPDAAEPALALAEALLRTPRLHAAVAALRRALHLAPGDIALRNNLAAALTRIHHYAEARDLLADLIAEIGEVPECLCNLANALVLLGEQRAGVAAARRAGELAPEMHLAWRTLAAALVYAEDDAAALRSIAERAAATLPPRPAAGVLAHDPGRRLRLGLLSPKLRTHPVGWLTVAGFEHLDPEAFELVCFAQAPSADPLQRRFAAVAAEWHEVVLRPPAEVAARVRARGIDVLIDLGGWGDDGMLAACAERPAPVQVKWVGNQSATTGLAAIDWMLTDRWQTPAGTECFYTERLFRMPDGYVCYTPPVQAPEVAPLPEGETTFACFNNLAKITPLVIATWAAILRRVPQSRLLLKANQFGDPATAARIAAAFAAEGIAADRLDLQGATPHRAHLAAHAAAHVVLDPFPYSGGLTTCEALWMGVPVVTLPGGSFASRHSLSHLSNVGLTDWVAADRAAYVEIAVRRAADRDRLAALRGDLRPRMAASPLCDAPRFGRALGDALRAMWRDACA